jgi:replication-associated recombination protein RarA
VRLSAVSSGVKDIRETIAQAQHLLGEKQRRTMVFIDEIHRFSTSQQDALLPAVESGLLVLVGATTENPFFEVNAPLRSRSTLFHLEPLSATHLSILIERGCAAENAHICGRIKYSVFTSFWHYQIFSKHTVGFVLILPNKIGQNFRKFLTKHTCYFIEIFHFRT